VKTPRLGATLLALLLAACSSTGNFVEDGPPASERLDIASIPNAVPKAEPRYASGNPASYQVLGHTYHVMDSSHGYVARGIASWYGTKFQGRLTSSGEPYDMWKMTAAHRSLPLPTYLQVTNLRNGRQVVVKVNDRGPFHENRLIDLSYAAARKLGIVGNGTGLVELRAIDPGAPTPPVPIRVAAAPLGDPHIYLQLGAFRDRLNAERLSRRLRADAGLAPVRVVKAAVGGAPLYRVRLGPLGSVDQADHLSATLARHGIRDPRVVVD